jgi:hypothetical protein
MIVPIDLCFYDHHKYNKIFSLRHERGQAKRSPRARAMEADAREARWSGQRDGDAKTAYTRSRV